RDADSAAHHRRRGVPARPGVATSTVELAAAAGRLPAAVLPRAVALRGRRPGGRGVALAEAAPHRRGAGAHVPGGAAATAGDRGWWRRTGPGRRAAPVRARWWS